MRIIENGLEKGDFFVKNNLQKLSMTRLPFCSSSDELNSHGIALGTILLKTFTLQFKFWCLFLSGVIATKFYTCHGSCAVEACAKICCNLMSRNRIIVTLSFYQIWSLGKNSAVKWIASLVYTVIFPGFRGYRQTTNYEPKLFHLK